MLGRFQASLGPLGFVWLGGWKVRGMENGGAMEKEEIEKV